MHFSKPEVFKAIEKISTENSHSQRSRGIKLLENISYELSHDMETLCHFALYARLTLEDFNSLKLSQKSLAHINKHLFIKRKYRRVSMRPTILKGRIRKYVIDRIVNFSFNDLYFQGEAIRQLTPKEKKHYIKKYPSLVRHFYHEDLCKYMNCLEKSQINDFIKNPENISVCKYYMKSIFGNSFSKNITLAKSIIRDWPNKDTCSVIDFDYLIHHNYEFKNF